MIFEPREPCRNRPNPWSCSYARNKDACACSSRLTPPAPWHHLAPFRLLRPDTARKLVRSAGNGFEILPIEEIPRDIEIDKRFAHLRVNLCDNVGGHAQRAEQTEPRHRIVTGKPALRDHQPIGRGIIRDLSRGG